MPFGSLHETVKARCRILGVPQEPISVLLTFWGGVERGFNGFSHNPENYAKKIDCPVLLQWGVNDNRVSKKETATIFANIKSSDKTLIEYLDSGHQSFCGNENEKWVRTVATFLIDLNN
jgi:esterase/lipase